MVFEITDRARIELEKVNKEPQIVFEVEGVDTVFSGVVLKKYVRIGDDDLEIGNDWRIGGLIEREDNSPYISFTKGTSTNIKQTIDQDRGETSSISSLDIAVIDPQNEVTALLKPDETESPVFELLGRRCDIWLGFADSGWKDDYIRIFRGYIQSYDAGAGFIKFNIASVEKLEDSEILPKVETELNGSIAASGVTSIAVDSNANFVNTQEPITVAGTFVGAEMFVKINDEIIETQDFQATTGFTTSDVYRGSLGTTAAAHSDGDTVESFYILRGNPFDVALQLLMGDNDSTQDYYASGVNITSFVRLPDGTTEDRSFYVRGVNLIEEYNIRPGDNIVIEQGPSASGNESGGTTVDTIEFTDDGSTVIKLVDSATINGAASGTFFEELETDSTFKVDTIYQNVWPFGLGLLPKDIDIDEFERLKNRFFSDTEMEYLVKDTINVREFIEQEIFKPLSLYAVPRKAKISVKYHFPPLPDEEILILDSSNVVSPSTLKISRSTEKNFYNAVAIKFEEQVLEDAFDRGVLVVQSDSGERMGVGTKTFAIEGKIFRDTSLYNGNSLSGTALATTAANRRIKKYKYGAEYIKGMKVNYKTGFRLEIGDIVVVNLADLKMTDIKSGTRSGESRLFEIENKTLNIKTGEVTIDLVDTNFDLDARYCLISPSSLVKQGNSGTEFVIKPRANQQTKQFGNNEYFKWQNLIGASLLVHNDDFSVSGVSTLASIDGNTLTVSTDLGFTPAEDYHVTLSAYDNQSSTVNNIYGSMTNATGFDDGTVAYQMV